VAPAAAAGNPDNRVASATQGPHYQPPNKGQMMEQHLAAHIPSCCSPFGWSPAPTAKSPRHQDAPALHRLGQPPALLTRRSATPDVLPRRPLAEGRPHLDDPHRRYPQHPHPQAHHADGDRRPRVLGLDGETIWYDWQYPKGEDFYLAGYNLKTGQRTAYHMQRDEWSIHFNLTKDLDMFTGDGGDPGQVARAKDGEWIELFRPQLIRGDADAINSPDFWQAGAFHSERLVNMSHHYYREEPNVRFSPDKSLVIFTSNMFGPSYVFGAETAKAVNPPPTDVISTPEPRPQAVQPHRSSQQQRTHRSGSQSRTAGPSAIVTPASARCGLGDRTLYCRRPDTLPLKNS
jgi:oligogalacturonide lyase